jgi:hypothetical protein
MAKIIRAGELSGRFTDPVTGQIDVAKMQKYFDLVARVTAATHGMVSPQTLLGMAQQGGFALRGLSEEGFLTQAIVAQAMGGPSSNGITARMPYWPIKKNSVEPNSARIACLLIYKFLSVRFAGAPPAYYAPEDDGEGRHQLAARSRFSCASITTRTQRRISAFMDVALRVASFDNHSAIGSARRTGTTVALGIFFTLELLFF